MVVGTSAPSLLPFARVHRLITDYPGAPGVRRSKTLWHLSAEVSRIGGEGGGAQRRLEWGRPPAKPERIEALQISARPAPGVQLPGWLRELPALKYLSLPLSWMRATTGDEIPPSAQVLELAGAGTVTVPKQAKFPHVGFLMAYSGVLKFGPDSFPGIERLGLKLDPAQAMLDTVSALSGLRALHLGSVHAASVFSRVGSLRLEYLGLSYGRLPNIEDIGLLSHLTSLQLKSLSCLESMEGVAGLPALEELSIGYCTRLRDVSDVANIPRLRRLATLGMRDVGISAILPTLKTKGLEMHSLAGVI